jgi:hypothetical protein
MDRHTGAITVYRQKQRITIGGHLIIISQVTGNNNSSEDCITGGDAIIPMIGYQWKTFKFMFSFDFTTSSLKNYNNMNGATEFYLQYSGFYNEYNGDIRQTLCPTFH